MKMKQIFQRVFFAITINLINGYIFDLANCPLYISEPCDNQLIRFILVKSSERRALDPFRPILPHDFNQTVPLKILIHGYGGLTRDYSITNVSLAYEFQGYNVILVDWEQLAAVPCYVTAYINTWHVGQCLAIFAVSMLTMGFHPLKVHVIGFSLGAHVASFASNHLERSLGIPFGRITGLDPALPFFASLNNDWKLDATDARFVDVIHTSAGTFGKIEPSGHVDFYINGGYVQPQCINRTYPQLCSHIMVGKYFADTIRNFDQYYGEECPSIIDYVFGRCNFTNAKKILMGEKCSHTSRGTYFVNTENLPIIYYLTKFAI